MSPHVNRQLERTNIAHRPSSAVRRPYPSQDGAADYMYEGLRNDPPKGVEPRLSSFNDYRSCTQRIFNFNKIDQVFVPAIASGSGRLHWHGCRSRMNPCIQCIQKRTFHPIPLAACPLDVHLPVCLGYIHTVYAPEDKKHHRPSVEWKEFPLHLRVE